MKIGVVHFGSYTTGATEIIKRLIQSSTKDIYSVFGIEWNRITNGIEVKELHTDSISQAEYNGDAVLNAFPEQYWNNEYSTQLEEIMQLDYVIVLGGNEELVSNSSIKSLHVPVSIFNDMDKSTYSLGYDTALNTVYSSIEKIRDTASSLIYDQLRVFAIQVPGEKYSPLVKDTGLAVDAPFVKKDDDESLSIIREAIQEKNSRQDTYLFIIMDYSVDHESLEKKITNEFDLDWKVMSVSESQCVGPFPTAVDRIVIRKVSDKILEVISSNPESGHLVIQDLQVIYQKS